MALFNNRAQILRAKDEDIESFFAETTFEGIYSSEIKSKNSDYYRGSITDIKLEGRPTNILPQFLNVPKTSRTIAEGPCLFKCRINMSALRAQDSTYIVNLVGGSLKPIEERIVTNKIFRETRSFNSEEETLFKRNLKLRNNLFIGKFTQNRDGSFTIRDIRRSDFSKLILQNGKEQTPIVYHPKYNRPEANKYYEFSWILNSVNKDEYVYNFKVDETKPFKEIHARDIINKLHTSIMDYSADAGQKIVKMLDTLKNQLTASGKEIFIYELLQNANDYPLITGNSKEKVDVEFHITQNSLVFLHSGAEFNERNIAAICSINDKEKTDNKDTIGYKGIGFKTVFLDNNYVYLQTGDFSFRFDREYSRDIVDTPWQILPVWTKYSELSQAEKYIFTNADKKFRVKFALRPTNLRTLRESSQNYVKMFKEVFKNERVILFIPNLTSVKIFLNGTPIPDIECRCDNDQWLVTDFEEPVPPEITETINSDIEEQEDTGSLKIPTKYYDFTKTKVSFACEIDGASLIEVKDSQIYCYLPTQASWGFKFLMNTDMIPTGPRDDIEIDFAEQININAEIAQIAGSKFFDWLKTLCDSKRFKLNSIFNLIPVFDTCISQHGKYKTLIKRFKDGFDEKLHTDELIPVKPNEYSLIENIILDETGITSSGIISDDDFFNITGLNGNLPIKVLRNDNSFKNFIRRYIKEFDCIENIWNIDSLKKLCSASDFQEWLKNQENNNKFLNFLLEKGYLEDFLSEEIFIEHKCGELYSANELYYDIDEELKDLSAFSEHISYLSLNTREYFHNNKDWENVIDHQFAEFKGEHFIKETLLNENWDKTIKALENWNTSFHFYNYIAKNDIVPDELKNLPFFNDEETAEIIDDFNDKFVFISSKVGKETCAASWLSQVDFAFVSPKYDKATLDYFKKNADVLDYSDVVIVNDIILSEDYREVINESQQENYSSSESFVSFCYKHESLFGSGSLKEYALDSADCDGENSFILSEEHIYFPSECFDEYSKKEWINNGWMYCLNSNYLKIDPDEEKIKVFLKKAFYIEELNASRFYKNIVRNKISDIIDNTSGNNDSDGKKNLDFIAYLDDNYKLIFEEEKDAEEFSSIILLKDSDGDGYYDIDSDSSYIYVYNDELKGILNSNWFPADTVNMCSSKYGESKAITTIKAKVYEFSDFFDDVIVEELENINDTIDTKESSIAFHTFIIERLRNLNDSQKEKMKGAKVYLYGCDDASNSSEGHKILSKSARELCSMGLVEFSDLDIIDPDYHIEDNEDYWKKHLNNEQFTVIDFFNWLEDNTSTFYDTIEDKENNINFWRWVKGCKLVDSTIEKLPVLPIYLSSGEYIDSDDIIYLSDNYIQEGGLETIVKKYHPEASFISAEYIYDNENIDAWKDFWVKLRVRFEMVDILIDTIDNRLDEIEDEKLPATLAKYRAKLDEHYNGELISKLTNLRIKAHDGNFYTIEETVYIDCEKDEPFSYIKLPNQISFDTAEQRKLIKDIIDEIDGDCIETLSEWQQRKVDYYLQMQDDDCESVRDFHFMFINELSLIRNTSKDSLKDIENIENIYLLNRDNEFCGPAVLTMGSAYNPFFNFEKCGITSLEYVSDSYLSNCSEYPGKLFRALKVHCDIQKDDLSLLENRDCAIYFWSKYLIKKEAAISRIKDFISDNLFDDIACIPTKDYMKSPKELYYGREVSKYVKNIEDWENKIPLMDLPDIKTSNDKTLFDELPFKKSLDFLDGLYALISVLGQERRTQILEWMIEDYDETYQEKVSEYREDEHALWNNNRNEPIHIKQLYALNYEEKTLEQYFGQNPRIVNKVYFPVGLSFKSACDILGIKIISLCDLKMEPLGDTPFTQRNNDLKLFALVIAGMIDTEGWQELYNGYIEKINSLVLHRCKSIMITYKDDEDINQSLRKFYHEAGSNDFYFVDSLDGKRVYTLFVKEFTEFIGIEKDDIPQEMIEDIMDSRENALELIREQNTLMLDDAFKDALDELIPGIKRELNGNVADDDDDETPITYRPTFTTTDSKVDEDDEDTFSSDISDRTDNANDNEISETPSDRMYDNTETNCSSQSDSGRNLTHPSERQNQHDDLDVEGGLRKPRSDKGSTHDYPTTREPRERKSSSNTTPTKASEGTHSYSDMNGWEGSRSSYIPQAPKPFSPEDVRNFGSRGVTRTLEVLEPTSSEVAEINRILGEDLSPEQVADQNYLAQLRLFNNLEKRGMTPNESKEDFVRNAHMKNEHTINGGKYIHKCSAAGGIMYLSPSIWNKIADDRCVVCVYLGAKANEFMYFNSIDDILEWVGEDDIVIKLTGEEKADVVEELYSGVLNGVKGTAYTLIRINSNEKYNSLFAQLPTNNEINETEENEDEY